MEAGQRGQKELIRATVALGSSCRQHPVPWNRLSPPSPLGLRVSSPGPRAQWVQRPSHQERMRGKTCLPSARNQAGSGAQRRPATLGSPEQVR